MEPLTPYFVGMTIYLWQMAHKPQSDYPKRAIPILRKVKVTIFDMQDAETNQPKEKPSPLKHIYGITYDGEKYERAWGYWPEKRTQWTHGYWSLRDDGAGNEPSWAPLECTAAYNAWVQWVKQYQRNQSLALEHTSEIPSLIGPDYRPILPEGDVTHCKDHDRYWLSTITCPYCKLAKRLQQAA